MLSKTSIIALVIACGFWDLKNNTFSLLDLKPLTEQNVRQAASLWA